MARPHYNEGRYRCEITNQGLGEASTGTPQFVLRIKVLETEDGEQLPAQYERTIYRAITEKTMPYFVEDLKALGYDRDSFKFLDPQQAGFQNFRGQIITAFCAHENDRDGNPREKWGIANDKPFEVKPIESAKLRQLDNLFAKQLKGLKGGLVSQPRAAVPQPKVAAASTAIEDNDVPF